MALDKNIVRRRRKSSTSSSEEPLIVRSQTNHGQRVTYAKKKKPDGPLIIIFQVRKCIEINI
jgi:hypothetical protein